MKVSPAHMAQLKDAVEAIDSPYWRNVYRTGAFPRADAVRDLDRRYRWDLYYAARGVLDDSADGYTMAHLDTALRRIVPPLATPDADVFGDHATLSDERGLTR